MKRILVLLAMIAAAVLVVSGVTLAAPLPSGGKITINDATYDATTCLCVVPSAATPYPSQITVSGYQSGFTISDVNLRLNGFTHTYPDDVDMLLVGPGGQEATVMSDVGLNRAVKNIRLILDDEAANSLPDAPLSALTSGTYQPTNYEVDSFPSPAPTPSGGSALSVFDGTDPNGTWKLYVADDMTGQEGQVRSWALEITAQ